MVTPRTRAMMPSVETGGDFSDFSHLGQVAFCKTGLTGELFKGKALLGPKGFDPLSDLRFDDDRFWGIFSIHGHSISG